MIHHSETQGAYWLLLLTKMYNIGIKINVGIYESE